MAVLYPIICLWRVLLTLVVVTRAETLKFDKTSMKVNIDYQYQSPHSQVNSTGVYIAEHFDDKTAFNQRWVQSDGKPHGVDESKWEIQMPIRKILENDFGLVLVSEGKHATISSLLDKPFVFKDKPLIVQYEVTIQDDQKCGGAYIKLISHGVEEKSDLRKLFDQSPYTILFGPDKCGTSNDLHFIFRYRNSNDANNERKYTKKLSQGLEDYYSDKEPHLYTLIILPDNTYTILIDNKVIIQESFSEDFTHPIELLEKTDQHTDEKSDYWDGMEKDVSHLSSKSNCRNFNAIRQPFHMTRIYAVSFALWSMTPMLLFDNVLVTDDPAVAQQWTAQTYALKRARISKDSDLDTEIKKTHVVLDSFTFKWKGEAEAQVGDRDSTDPRIQNEATTTGFKIITLANLLNNEIVLTVERVLGFLNGEHWMYAGVVIGSFTLIAFGCYMCRERASDINKNKENSTYGQHYKFKTESEEKTVEKGEYHNQDFSISNEKKKLEDTTSKPKVEQSDNANPWMYAGIIVGSMITVGVVTYNIWSALKSDSVEKSEKTDDVIEDDGQMEKEQRNMKNEPTASDDDTEDETRMTDTDAEYDSWSFAKVAEEIRLPPDDEDIRPNSAAHLPEFTSRTPAV